MKIKQVHRVVVGLTGGVACGKSTVVRELRRLGAQNIDADRIAHAVILPGGSCYKKIVFTFGSHITVVEGGINRKKLRDIIFADSTKRRILERITHPVIIRKIKEKLKRIHHGFIVIDAPLLFEAHLTGLVDHVVVVWSSRKKQLERVMKRDQVSLKGAKAMIDAQMPLADKIKNADIVLRNTGSIGEIKKCASRLYHTLWKK